MMPVETGGNTPAAPSRRPRDEFGRPLARSEPTRLRLENFDALPIEENHRLGSAHFDAQRFFAAHEAWETCWKQTPIADERTFFKGLAQLAAGYVHLQRGNPRGAYALLRRAAGHLERYVEHRGLQGAAIAETARADADRIEAAPIAGHSLACIGYPCLARSSASNSEQAISN